jgi:TP901 family phage tail tape measure protein
VAAAYNITAEMNLRLASGAAAGVANDLRKQLAGQGLNVPVAVKLDRGADAALNRLNAQLGQASASARGLNRTVEEGSTGLARFGEQAGLAARRFLAFTTSASLMIGLTRAIRGGISEAIEFEREMVRIAQVSNETNEKVAAVGREVTRLATAFGVSSAELARVATTFKQAGLSLTETGKALEAVAKAALAPNFDSMAQTAEGAIAVMRQFKVDAAGLEGALGAMNAVAGDFAVEARDLIEVVRRAGGTFRSTGGDLNELLGLFTAVRATTRESAESISTGLRTIFARLQRQDTVDALQRLGVTLREVRSEAERSGDLGLEGQFVGAYEAVRRLSEATSRLRPTDPRFAAIAEELGGYRQLAKVIPLLQQFETAQRAVNVAQAGNVSLSAAAERAQDALAVRAARVKEEFSALFRSFVQSNGFQAFAGTVLSLANSFGKLLQFLGPVVPLLTTLATIKIATGLGTFLGGFARRAVDAPVAANVRGYARGGVVPGSGSGDTVPAYLEPGEFVIKKSSAQSIGYERLRRMNRFADGGPALLALNSNGNVRERDDVRLLKLTPAFQGAARRYVNQRMSYLEGDSPPRFDSGPRSTVEGILFERYVSRHLRNFNPGRGLDFPDLKRADLRQLAKLTGITQREAEEVAGLELKRTASARNLAATVRKAGFASGGGVEARDAIRGVIQSTGMRLPPRRPRDDYEYSDLRLYLGQLTWAWEDSSAAGRKRLQPFMKRLGLRPQTDHNGELRWLWEDKRRAYDLGSAAGLDPRKFASGGKANASDVVPALLTPGEFVFGKEAAGRIGYHNLKRMNEGGSLPGFAQGGAVGYVRFAEGDIVQRRRIDSLNPKDAPAVFEGLNAALKNTSKALQDVSSVLVRFKGDVAEFAGGVVYKRPRKAAAAAQQAAPTDAPASAPQQAFAFDPNDPTLLATAGGLFGQLAKGNPKVKALGREESIGVALARAYEVSGKFDPSQGAAFPTYAYKSMEEAILNAADPTRRRTVREGAAGDETLRRAPAGDGRREQEAVIRRLDAQERAARATTAASLPGAGAARLNLAGTGLVVEPERDPSKYAGTFRDYQKQRAAAAAAAQGQPLLLSASGFATQQPVYASPPAGQVAATAANFGRQAPVRFRPADVSFVPRPQADYLPGGASPGLRTVSYDELRSLPNAKELSAQLGATLRSGASAGVLPQRWKEVVKNVSEILVKENEQGVTQVAGVRFQDDFLAGAGRRRTPAVAPSTERNISYGRYALAEEAQAGPPARRRPRRGGTDPFSLAPNAVDQLVATQTTPGYGLTPAGEIPGNPLTPVAAAAAERFPYVNPALLPPSDQYQLASPQAQARQARRNARGASNANSARGAAYGLTPLPALPALVPILPDETEFSLGEVRAAGREVALAAEGGRGRLSRQTVRNVVNTSDAGLRQQLISNNAGLLAAGGFRGPEALQRSVEDVDLALKKAGTRLRRLADGSYALDETFRSASKAGVNLNDALRRKAAFTDQLGGGAPGGGGRGNVPPGGGGAAGAAPGGPNPNGGGRFSPGFGTFLLGTGLQYLSAGIEGLSPNPEQIAYAGGRGAGTYVAAQGAAGAASGAATGALIGSALPIPGGGVIGAAVGGIFGFVSAIKEAERQLREAKIAKALNDFSDRLQTLVNAGPLATFETLSNVRTSLSDYSRLAGERAVADSTGGFFGGYRFDLNAYFGNRSANVRRELGGQLPALQQYLESQTRDIVRRSPEATRDQVFERLQGAGASREFIALLGSIRNLNPREVEREQLQNIERVQRQERATADARAAQLGEDRNVNTFGRFLLSVQGASDSLLRLRQESQLLSEVFTGTVNAGRVSLRPDALEQFGRNDSGALRPLQTLANVAGEAGQRLLEAGRAGDSVASALPAVLSQVASSAPLEGQEFITAVRRGLRDALGGENALTDQQRVAINTVTGGLSRVSGGEQGPAEIIRRLQADSTGFADELLRPFLGPIRDSGQRAARAFEEEANRFLEGLATYRQQVSAYGEALDRASQARLTARGAQAEFESFRRGERRQAPELLGLAELQAPLRARQERLTGLRGAAADDPEAVARRLRSTLGAIPAAQRRLQDAAERDPTSAEFRSAGTALVELRGRAANLQQALQNLANVSERNAAVQERLNVIQRERESRLGLAERYVTGSADDRAQLDRGALLANLANNQGRLDNFGEEDRRTLVGYLRSAGNATLTGLAGSPRANELLERLLTGGRAGGAFGLPEGQRREEGDLRRRLADNAQAGEQAARSLADTYRDVSGQFFDRLTATNVEFINQLRTVFLRREELGARQLDYNRLADRVRVTGDQQRQAGTLRSVGVTTNDQVRQLGQSREALTRYLDASARIQALTRVSENLQPGRVTDILRDTNGFTPPLDLLNELRGYVAGLGIDPTTAGNVVADPRVTTALGAVQLRRRLNPPQNEAQLNDLATQVRRPLFDALRRQLEEASPAQRDPGTLIGRALNARDAARTGLQGIGGLNLDALGSLNDQQSRLLLQSLQTFGEGGANFERLGQEADSLGRQFRELGETINALRAQLGLAQLPNPQQAQGPFSGWWSALNFAASGGSPARGTDTVPAMLTPGEFVVNRDSARANIGLLTRINSARGPLYMAFGGYIGEEVDRRRREEYGEALARSEYEDVQRASAGILAVGGAGSLAGAVLTQAAGASAQLNPRLEVLSGGRVGEEGGADYLARLGGELGRVSANGRTSGLTNALSYVGTYGRRGSALSAPSAPQQAGPSNPLGNELSGVLNFYAASDPYGAAAGTAGVIRRAQQLRQLRGYRNQLNAQAGDLFLRGGGDRYERLSREVSRLDSQLSDRSVNAALREASTAESFRMRLGAVGRLSSLTSLAGARDPFAAFGAGRADSDQQLRLGLNAGASQVQSGLNRRLFPTPRPFGRPNRLYASGQGGAPYGFAGGGVVPGDGPTDSVLSLLTPGEFVVPNRAVSRVGVPALQRFANGGVVGGFGAGSDLGSEGAAGRPKGGFGAGPALGAFERAADELQGGLGGFNESARLLTTALNSFVGSANELAAALRAFPATLNFNGSHTVTVTVTGAEALAKLEGRMKEVAEEAVTEKTKDIFRKYMPEANFTVE